MPKKHSYFKRTSVIGASLLAACMLRAVPAGAQAAAGVGGAPGAAAGAASNGVGVGTAGQAGSGIGMAGAGQAGNGIGAGAPGQAGNAPAGAMNNGAGVNGTMNNTTGANGTATYSATPGTSQTGSSSRSTSPALNLSQTRSAPSTAQRLHLTLPEAVAASLQASTDLVVAQRNVDIDRRREDEVSAALRPNITANGSATRFDAPTTVSIGGGPPVQVVGSHTENLGLNVAERLDLTGQIRAARTQARLQRLADEISLRQITNSRVFMTRQAYFGLLRAVHQRQVALAERSAAGEQQRVARQLYEQQVGQKIDLLRANTAVANADQDVVRTTAALGIAQANLNSLVGNSVTTSVTVDDTDTSFFAYLTPPANGAVGSVSVAPFVPSDPVAALAEGSLEQRALQNRPDVAIDVLNTQIAETGITIARAGLAPALTINAGANYYPTLSFQTPRQRTAEITATLSLPLYDGGATRDRIEEARYRAQNSRDIAASHQTDVTLQVDQAYLNATSAEQAIAAATTAVNQALAAQQLAQVRYAGQVGLYLEVTDAQTALVQAETNQLDAYYNYQVARAQLENVVGVPILR